MRDNAFEVTKARVVRAKRIDKEYRLGGGIQLTCTNHRRLEAMHRAAMNDNGAESEHTAVFRIATRW